YVIGLVDGLEARLGLLATISAIRMMFLRQPAIGGLDRRVIRAALHSQQFVIVLFDHHGSPLRNTWRRPLNRCRRQPAISPCSRSRRLRKIPRRPPLPAQPALRPARTCLLPGRPQLRSLPAAAAAAADTWPARASSPP